MCVLVLHEMDFVDQEKKSWLSDGECLGLIKGSAVPYFIGNKNSVMMMMINGSKG